MAGGLRFTPEQIRELPLSMQMQIGLGIAAQLSQAVPVAGQNKEVMEEENAAEMRSKGICPMPIQCDLY